MDYLPHDNFIIPLVRLVPSKWSPWDVGNWADVPLKDLKEQMRFAYNKNIERIGRKNLMVAKKWTWKGGAKLAIKALQSL